MALPTADTQDTPEELVRLALPGGTGASALFWTTLGVVVLPGVLLWQVPIGGVLAGMGALMVFDQARTLPGWPQAGRPGGAAGLRWIARSPSLPPLLFAGVLGLVALTRPPETGRWDLLVVLALFGRYVAPRSQRAPWIPQIATGLVLALVALAPALPELTLATRRVPPILVATGLALLPIDWLGRKRLPRDPQALVDAARSGASPADAATLLGINVWAATAVSTFPDPWGWVVFGASMAVATNIGVGVRQVRADATGLHLRAGLRGWRHWSAAEIQQVEVREWRPFSMHARTLVVQSVDGATRQWRLPALDEDVAPLLRTAASAWGLGRPEDG